MRALPDKRAVIQHEDLIGILDCLLYTSDAADEL